MKEILRAVRDRVKFWEGNPVDFFRKDFFRNGIIHWALIGMLIVNVSNWLAAFYFIRPVDYPIILHYNVYFGVDILGNWMEAYFLPGAGTVLALINILSAFWSYFHKERIAAYLFLLAAFLIQVGVAIAEGSIIRINY